jgi:cytochrome c peroxidase
MKKITLSTIFAGSILAVLFLASSGAAKRNPQSTQLEPIQQLGKELFFDNISDPPWVSCSTCHGPEVGWTGPVAGINLHGSVYRGAVPIRFGNRKPPSAAYATFSPILHWDADEGVFVGGNFWDGRATGKELDNPTAEQARAPFLNPVEQHMPSKLAVCEHVRMSKYAELFEQVWGTGMLDCSESGVDATYNRIAFSIAYYEDSSEVNQFSSKYDYYLMGEVSLTDQEMLGLQLFEGDAGCSGCHPSEPGPDGELPLFTDFTYDNLGVPRNPELPFYKMDEVFLDDGSPINPLGEAWVDLGLGGFLANSGNTDWQDLAADNMGKQKVPTLRNVAKGPGKGFPKAYMHNGVFKSLAEVVHFYNTRDVEDWPPPEVAENVNQDELGDLGLTAEQEAALVAFMETLSDGYRIGKK